MFGSGFSSLQFTRDGRSLYYRQGNGIYALAISTGFGDRASTETIAQKLSAADRGSRGREVAVQPAHVVMVVVARMQRVMLLAQKEHVLS